MRLASMLSLLILLVTTAEGGSKPATAAAEQAASKPRVAAVLAMRDRLDAAVIARDMKAIEGLIAPDAVLNGPNNRINDRASIIANIAAGRVDHGVLERSIEFIAERGSDVILMGQETTRPRNPGEGGKTAHRRFTDIWSETSEGWKIVLRQATVYASE